MYDSCLLNEFHLPINCITATQLIWLASAITFLSLLNTEMLNDGSRKTKCKFLLRYYYECYLIHYCFQMNATCLLNECYLLFKWILFTVWMNKIETFLWDVNTFWSGRFICFFTFAPPTIWNILLILLIFLRRWYRGWVAVWIIYLCSRVQPGNSTNN